MLSGLQRRLVDMVAAPRVAAVCAGRRRGAVLRGEVDRVTEDLDYFSRAAQAVASLADAVERAVVEAGMAVQPVQRGEGFVRMIVTPAHEHCRLDIAQDARIRPAEQTDVGPVLALEELAADKVLALFGRAEPRDFVDVAALVERFGWPRLLSLAAEKDRGFDVGYFLDALRAFDRLRPQQFDLPPRSYDDLAGKVAHWRQEVTRLRSRDFGVDL